MLGVLGVLCNNVPKVDSQSTTMELPLGNFMVTHRLSQRGSIMSCQQEELQPVFAHMHLPGGALHRSWLGF